MISRSINSITFSWEDGLSDGGAPIHSYVVTYQEIGSAASSIRTQTITRGSLND